MTFVPAWSAGLAVNVGQVIAPTSVNGFVYEATMGAAGRTGTSEPAWPLVAAGTVVDGTVTWTARTAQAITWTARALYKSAGTEPAWPITAGATVTDGNITWTCASPYISDSKCPNTKQVIVIGSKVYAVANDVTRYCVTNNPMDWSTPNDAGFLPTGMHCTGEIEGRALGEYRGNLAFWSASDLQIWQVDPDPAQMQLLDTISGVGTIYDKANASISSDMAFLTPQGVRSAGVAAANSNMQDEDIGTPIDSMIRAELAGGAEPLAFYNPSLGEWWTLIGTKGFVYQRARSAEIQAWSRDEWPVEFTDWALLNGETFLRSGDTVYRVDASATTDSGVGFAGTIWWHYLDLGSPGVTKQLVGVDIVGEGTCALTIGYDQTAPAAITASLTIGPDSVPGGIIPIPIAAPSLSPKLVYAAGQAWRFEALNLWLNDFRTTA